MASRRDPGDGPGQGCGSARGGRFDRRTFLELSGAGALGALARRLPAPSARLRQKTSIPGDAELIPADKALDPAWLASLTAPGSPSRYRDEELRWIGMPVGGLFAGQVYLGGDGTLWHWDIFNDLQHGVRNRGNRGANYVEPLEPASPFSQGFAVRIHSPAGPRTRRLDRSGFGQIDFRGRYPIGEVTYRDADCPVEVTLEAFSPFIPLATEASSYPAVVVGLKISNDSERPLRVDLGGWLENAICERHRRAGLGRRRNRVARTDAETMLVCSAVEPPADPGEESPRPDILFDDFEKELYGDWTVTGTAFGTGPVRAADMPAYQGDVGCQGERLVNSHNARSGEDVRAADAHTGQMLSRPFIVERHFITFLIGGGAHPKKTCIDLLVDDRVVASATGHEANRLQPHSFDVRAWQGRKARLRIVDDERGGWGNIGIDEIIFSDRARWPDEELDALPDFGTMALTLRGGARVQAFPELAGDDPAAALFDALDGTAGERSTGLAPAASVSLEDRLVGALACSLSLEAHTSARIDFLVTWHFPNLRLPRFSEPVGHWYATVFSSAEEVARALARDLDRLRETTRRWVACWYGSTLPQWFLERTFINTSILATSTCHRFANGRFYGWEGVGCCEGTCTHVWHYAQAPGRLFPDFERDRRQRVDLGLALDPDSGRIGHRGELNRAEAHDGQAGIILSCLREHQMSADGRFLTRNWPRIKKATEFLILRDGNDDGLIEGAQPNTLDAAWWGQIAWLESLYLAALRAAEVMATRVGDPDFAIRCRAIQEQGRRRIVELFNGEYFIQLPDPARPDAVGSYRGCYIDQVIGQGWAFQVGLGRLYDAKRIHKALHSLWRYNFTSDVGPFKRVHPEGRPYAVAGEGGLLMCTWPHGGRPAELGRHWQAMYFNECMTGFEYQVAGHMLWEGMVTEGLAITRTIHDRYHPRRRNPYNEIECSDHYARAMASYGVFLAACGHEWDGPAGHFAMAPRVGADEFRAAFTASEGWGRYRQSRPVPGRQEHRIDLEWGRMRLATMTYAIEEDLEARAVRVRHASAAGRRELDVHVEQHGPRVAIRLAQEVTLETGESLEIEIMC